MRALWIEMLRYTRSGFRAPGSRPVRALWIEIEQFRSKAEVIKSRPVRALWIEIILVCTLCSSRSVEAREGLVD